MAWCLDLDHIMPSKLSICLDNVVFRKRGPLNNSLVRTDSWDESSPHSTPPLSPAGHVEGSPLKSTPIESPPSLTPQEDSPLEQSTSPMGGSLQQSILPQGDSPLNATLPKSHLKLQAIVGSTERQSFTPSSAPVPLPLPAKRTSSRDLGQEHAHDDLDLSTVNPNHNTAMLPNTTTAPSVTSTISLSATSPNIPVTKAISLTATPPTVTTPLLSSSVPINYGHVTPTPNSLACLGKKDSKDKENSPLKLPKSQEKCRQMIPSSQPHHVATTPSGRNRGSPPVQTDTDTEEMTSEKISHVTITSQDTRYVCACM